MSNSTSTGGWNLPRHSRVRCLYDPVGRFAIGPQKLCQCPPRAGLQNVVVRASVEIRGHCGTTCKEMKREEGDMNNITIKETLYPDRRNLRSDIRSGRACVLFL